MIHNHPILYLLVLMLAVPILLSCTTPPPPDTTAEDTQAIKVVRNQLTYNFNQGDAAAVASLYTDEAKLLPPKRPMIVGKEGIQAFNQAGIDAGVGDLRFTVIDLSVNGDMAYVVGKQTVTIQPEEGEAISENNKYVWILKRENGTWKLDVVIFNSSVPLPAPEEEMTEEE